MFDINTFIEAILNGFVLGINSFLDACVDSPLIIKILLLLVVLFKIISILRKLKA